MATEVDPEPLDFPVGGFFSQSKLDQRRQFIDPKTAPPPRPLEDDEPDPDWEEDEEGFVRAPLSYENREGDPAFNGAFDKW